jgi:DNA repair exonuclease SbcCD nuclease subunit
MKVLHCADLHIREKDIEEIATCLQYMVDKAQGVDLIIIAGDTFDSRDIKLDSRAAKLAIKTISALADIASVAVIVGTPSHDGPAPEVLRYARGAHFVPVASVPEQIYLVGGELSRAPGIGNIKPDAILSIVPQPTKQFFNQGDIQTSNEAIAHGMTGLFAGFGAQAAEFPRIPHLLVGHWNVSGSKLSTGQVLTGQDIDISIDAMGLTNASAHLLGHIHLPQQLGDRTFYSGSPYPLTWGEAEEKGFWIHEFDADELYKSEFMKTPCRKLVRLTQDRTQQPSAVLVYPEMEGACVRIDITTWQDEAEAIDKDTIREMCMNAGALDVDIRINAVPRETIRAAAVLEAETLKDEFAEMAKLRGEDIDPETLSMAEQLETVPAEELLKTIAEAA